MPPDDGDERTNYLRALNNADTFDREHLAEADSLLEAAVNAAIEVIRPVVRAVILALISPPGLPADSLATGADLTDTAGATASAPAFGASPTGGKPKKPRTEQVRRQERERKRRQRAEKKKDQGSATGAGTERDTSGTRAGQGGTERDTSLQKGGSGGSSLHHYHQFQEKNKGSSLGNDGDGMVSEKRPPDCPAPSGGTCPGDPSGTADALCTALRKAGAKGKNVVEYGLKLHRLGVKPEDVKRVRDGVLLGSRDGIQVNNVAAVTLYRLFKEFLPEGQPNPIKPGKQKHPDDMSPQERKMILLAATRTPRHARLNPAPIPAAPSDSAGPESMRWDAEQGEAATAPPVASGGPLSLASGMADVLEQLAAGVATGVGG